LIFCRFFIKKPVKSLKKSGKEAYFLSEPGFSTDKLFNIYRLWVAANSHAKSMKEHAAFFGVFF
jgi:hypothetical protein